MRRVRRPRTDSPNAELMLLLLEIVGDEGVNVHDAALFIGRSHHVALAILAALRVERRATLVTGHLGSRVFRWCQPRHADDVALCIGAKRVRGGGDTHQYGEDEDNDTEALFAGPLVQRTIPAATASRIITAAPPSVFHLGGLAA